MLPCAGPLYFVCPPPIPGCRVRGVGGPNNLEHQFARQLLPARVSQKPVRGQAGSGAGSRRQRAVHHRLIARSPRDTQAVERNIPHQFSQCARSRFSVTLHGTPALRIIEAMSWVRGSGQRWYSPMTIVPWAMWRMTPARFDSGRQTKPAKIFSRPNNSARWLRCRGILERKHRGMGTDQRGSRRANWSLAVVFSPINTRSQTPISSGVLAHLGRAQKSPSGLRTARPGAGPRHNPSAGENASPGPMAESRAVITPHGAAADHTRSSLVGKWEQKRHSDGAECL